eukprot:TRINITY_DN10704_c0_g1_i1.p1 TRINITY_DN10704_c0_g1~~TRINITY_DN10704_c0_g1_i1.p1  ORF type:complete len:150 (+),score=55.22 TRINITY_DN10704_c0_g1_i1:445-894(+)
MKLIDFQKKRYKNKVETARKLTPQRSFERLLVYSNKPKFNLETSLKRLDMIKNQGIERVNARCRNRSKDKSFSRENANRSKNFIEKNKEDIRGANKRSNGNTNNKKYYKKTVRKERIEDQVETELAKELLPALEETMAKMYSLHVKDVG